MSSSKVYTHFALPRNSFGDALLCDDILGSCTILNWNKIIWFFDLYARTFCSNKSRKHWLYIHIVPASLDGAVCAIALCRVARTRARTQRDDANHPITSRMSFPQIRAHRIQDDTQLMQLQKNTFIIIIILYPSCRAYSYLQRMVRMYARLCYTFRERRKEYYVFLCGLVCARLWQKFI